MSYKITEQCNGCTACSRICPVGAIQGERKSVHQINVRACIDCGACGRMCPQEAILNESGEPCVSMKPALWPKPVFNAKLCTSCRICIEDCPVQCLSQNNDVKDKHPRPFLENIKLCISCGFCADGCPVGAIELKTPNVDAQPKANKAV